jgi:hypothetical protein
MELKVFITACNKQFGPWGPVYWINVFTRFCRFSVFVERRIWLLAMIFDPSAWVHFMELVAGKLLTRV